LQDVDGTHLLAPLAASQVERRKGASEKSAATKVEFFTVARQN
jgi:alpha-D-ribose 1-methylphosphonate 5-triphosphate synthase subunit PhnG